MRKALFLLAIALLTIGTFAQEPTEGTLYAVTVTKDLAETGRGQVISSPTGISCGNACASQSVNFLDGSQVTLTAIASRRVVPHYNVMGVAKAALEASVRHLAFDLGPAGIRVNAVSAGAVRTVAAMGVPGFRDVYRQGEALAPLRRGLTSRDVARAVTWLASDASGAVTGQVIEVDAGWSILALGGSPAPD